MKETQYGEQGALQKNKQSNAAPRPLQRVTGKATEAVSYETTHKVPLYPCVYAHRVR